MRAPDPQLVFSAGDENDVILPGVADKLCALALSLDVTCDGIDCRRDAGCFLEVLFGVLGDNIELGPCGGHHFDFSAGLGRMHSRRRHQRGRRKGRGGDR